VVESTVRMMSSLTRRIRKLFFLVPAKQWYYISGAGILSILAGIGNTLVSDPVTLNKNALSLPRASYEKKVVANKSVPIPSNILGKNLFRAERKSYASPKATAKKEGDTVPEVILKGTIISNDQRVAIIDGKIKKLIKVKMGERPEISGAKYQELKARGLDYHFIPVGEESVEGESFYEGSRLSDYIIERVYEDRIELVNISSGKSTEIFLDTDEHKKRMKDELLRAVDHTPKPLVNDFHLSGTR